MSLTLDELSPAEIAADMLSRWGDPDLAPSGVVVGPANDAAQQSGVVSVVAGGLPSIEKYVPVQWLRAQFRCLAPTLESADRIAQGVMRDMNGKVRKRCRMASTDRWYLVHLSNVTAGPSMHYDSPETYETLLFAELMIGTDPLDLSALFD